MIQYDIFSPSYRANNKQCDDTSLFSCYGDICRHVETNVHWTNIAAADEDNTCKSSGGDN